MITLIKPTRFASCTQNCQTDLKWNIRGPPRPETVETRFLLRSYLAPKVFIPFGNLTVPKLLFHTQKTYSLWCWVVNLLEKNFDILFISLKGWSATWIIYWCFWNFGSLIRILCRISFLHQFKLKDYLRFGPSLKRRVRERQMDLGEEGRKFLVICKRIRVPKALFPSFGTSWKLKSAVPGFEISTWIVIIWIEITILGVAPFYPNRHFYLRVRLFTEKSTLQLEGRLFVLYVYIFRQGVNFVSTSTTYYLNVNLF